MRTIHALAPATPIPSSRTAPALDGGLSADDFRLAFRNHPAGVAVITADAGDGPIGLTATSVISVSAEPPLLMFSLSSGSSSAPAIRAARTIVVHLLGADQVGLAQTFATSGIDRFADVASWGRLATGEPYLRGAAVRIRSRIVDRIQAGGSTVVAAHALDAHFDSDNEAMPLVYHNRTWHGLNNNSRLDR